jgi:hypothetical protein
MATRSVSEVVRRAVLLQISVTSPVLITCGGAVDGGVHSAGSNRGVVAGGGESGVVAEGGDGGVVAGEREGGAEAGARCSVASLPSSAYGGTCLNGVSYDFNGTMSECVGNDVGAQVGIGGIPLGVCETLCPPVSESGATWVAGDLLSYCMILTGCPRPGCTTNELRCEYGIPGCTATGRRPRGLRSLQERHALSPAGRFLVRMAHLEAASVIAFERLAHELEAHGAPWRLRRSALRASRDEVRHARIATRLAKRAGGSVREPLVRKSRERSLVAMAVENAVEGCVNETFGAAIAMAQSMAAPDPRLRAAMRQIARDEMRHAQLAWSVAEWVDRRLSEPERAWVTKARTRAARALIRATCSRVERELIDDLGLPPPRVAHAIAVDLAAALWAVHEC